MRLLRLSSLYFCALLICAALPARAQVVISQVYGGGGNSGATYTNDFIEIFNAGASPVSLAGYSVQYASATGTSWQVTNLPSTSLAAGQYLLVQEAQGAGGTTALPTPQATGTIAMSASAGKVALSSSTAAFTVACPTTGLVSLVAFGTTANCPTPTGNTSNTTGARRKTAGCTISASNNADFDIIAPTPRNTSTALNPCGVVTPSNPTVTATATPSAAQVGELVLLRATVQPGSNPVSTGIAVVANLSAIGGAANQSMYDNASNGDVTAGDNIFSFSATIPAGTSTGSKSIGVGVGDAQLRSASATVSLSVVQLMAIHDVQGSGLLSPFNGQVVVVEGIVTARRSNGFFLQAAAAGVDANPATSEGILVFTNAAPSGNAAVGNSVRVMGTVAEFKSSTNPHQLTLTELTSPDVSLLSTGNPLPAPVVITSALANASGPIDNLERLEGMRVSIPTLNVVAPVGAFIAEATASSPLDGVFFGVVPGVARPFREPGVGALETTVFPGGISPTVFDTNPERIRVQSSGQVGAPLLGADVGDSFTGLVGVLEYGFGAYNLLPDPSAPIVVTPGSTPTAVSVAGTSEITVGGFNLQRFFDDVNAPGISDPVLTVTALSNRLKKTANAICGYVRTPDILGVVEVENIEILTRLANNINTGDTQAPGSCARNPQYSAYLQEGNDVGGIDVGFLVSAAEVSPGAPRVQVLDMIQLGKDTTISNPDGSTSLLNDRPSLLLLARVNQANGAHYDLTVIINHLRSLSGVNSTDPGSNGWSSDGARIRAKRAAQAAYLAGIIHARQVANPSERIVLLGDFNAFEFNDGYTDSMGVITGRESPAGSVLNYVDSPITTPLTNMAELSPAGERYSFSFDGNAQSLDHAVVNQTVLDSTASVRAEHARINADFGEDNYGDFTVPVRVSDHDPVVLFLGESAFATADLAVAVNAGAPAVLFRQTASFGVGIANAGADAARPVTVDFTLDEAISGVQAQPSAGWTCSSPVASGGATRWTCTAASLDAQATGNVAVLVPTSAAVAGMTLALSATVQSPMTDPSLGNNTGSASVLVADAAADLAAKVAGPMNHAVAGKLAVFPVGLTNRGPNAARSAVLTVVANAPRQSIVMVVAPGFRCQPAASSPSQSSWRCTAYQAYPSGGRTSAVVVTQTKYALRGVPFAIGANFSSATVDLNPANNTSAAPLFGP